MTLTAIGQDGVVREVTAPGPRFVGRVTVGAPRPLMPPEVSPRPSAGTPRRTLVIPTFNERANIAALLAELANVLPADDTEVIFVDDSTDDTPSVIETVAATCPLRVRVLHRDRATGGLGGAVVEGLRLAQGEWIVVMDGDLQHPPSVVPDLIAAGVRDGADVVVASRYATNAGAEGLADSWRRLVSRAFTVTAKLLFWRALVRITDPMSGFFAVRASSLRTGRLRPFGYKILLELVVRTRPARVVEVPYRFDRRYAGESKSSAREGLRFLAHVATLRASETFARARPQSW